MPFLHSDLLKGIYSAAPKFGMLLTIVSDFRSHIGDNYVSAQGRATKEFSTLQCY